MMQRKTALDDDEKSGGRCLLGTLPKNALEQYQARLTIFGQSRNVDIRVGALPVVRIKRRVLVRPKDIERYLSQHLVKARGGILRRIDAQGGRWDARLSAELDGVDDALVQLLGGEE